MDSSDLVARWATIADYDAVMDIGRNVYGGFDYLPAIYYEVFHNPHNMAAVVEHKGKVVGFAMHLWMGPGRVNGGAGRVHADYQNMGVTKVLYGKLRELSLKKHGSPLTIYGEYVDTERSRRYTESSPRFKLLREWHALVFASKNVNVKKKSHLFFLQSPVTEIMTRTHAVSLQGFLSPQMFAGIKSLLNKEHESFGHSRTNNFPVEDCFIRDAAQRLNVLVTSTKSSENKLGEDEVIAVSFTCICMCKLGILVQIWFYTKTPDVSLLHAHVHMACDKLALIIEKNDVALLLHFPNTLPVVDADNGLKERLGSGIPQNIIPTNRMMAGKTVYTAKL